MSGGGGGGGRMTALFSNAPPGTTRGPLFRFLQIGGTIPKARFLTGRVETVLLPLL